MKQIKRQMHEIPIPDTLHSRCIMGIEQAKKEKENTSMKKTTKRLVAAAAALVLCVGALAAGTPAFADSIEGYFRDIYKGTAVVGTEYMDAAEEVDLTVAKAESVIDGTVQLTVSIRFDRAEEAPYRYIDAVAMGNFIITDSSGKTVVRVSDADGTVAGTAVMDGYVELTLHIGADLLTDGEIYTLEAESFFGQSKAEAPLAVYGPWACEFNVA